MKEMAAALATSRVTTILRFYKCQRREYIKIIVNEQAKLKQHVNESGHKSISVLLQSIYSFGYSVSMLYYARKKEIIDMSKFRLKKLGKKCKRTFLHTLGRTC